MILAHKIELRCNNKQRTYFAKTSGTARFAYNWALAQWKAQYQANKENPELPKPNQGLLRKQLNAIKREQFPWMLEVTKNAPQMAIIQLGQAFNRFFKGLAKHPRFKKKGINDSFTLTNDQFKLDDSLSRIKIPNLGWVRLREPLRFHGKILSATVSRQADRWMVSISVDTNNLDHLKPAENQGVVGVDLGVTTLAKLSTGESVVGSKPLKTLLQRLKRLSRALSRKQKGSANRKKAQMQLARLHRRIANSRYVLHKELLPIVFKGINNLNNNGLKLYGRINKAVMTHQIRIWINLNLALRKM